jgi:hypothetical protein
MTAWKSYGEANETLAEPPLRLTADGTTMTSWRATVRLRRGTYRFEGTVETLNVTALPASSWSGATLRVHGGAERSEPVIGTSGPKTLVTRIEVEGLEEEIILICDLRAKAGEARFDQLRLVQEADGTIRANSACEGSKKE